MRQADDSYHDNNTDNGDDTDGYGDIKNNIFIESGIAKLFYINALYLTEYELE